MTVIDLIGNNFASFFCVTILLLFIIINKRVETKIRIGFLVLGLLIIAETLRTAFEVETGIAADKNGRYVLLYGIGCILRPFMLYILVLIMVRKHRKFTKLLLGIPLAVAVVMVALANTSELVFFYSEGTIVYGPLYVVLKLCIAAYLIISIAVGISTYREGTHEYIIVLTCAAFIAANLVNEAFFDLKYDIRNEAIAISALSYFMYFCSLHYHKEIKALDVNYHENEEKITALMIDQSIETLAYTIDAKDRYTRGHSIRVAKYSRMIAERCGKPEEMCRQVYLAGLLHDIGKIAIPEEIIHKSGKLTKEEFDEIKTHPEKGAKILEKMKSLPYLQVGALHHHERYDGTGYPSGLKGEEIPEIARIIAVADAYDAMSSHRSYRRALDQSVIRQEIWKGAGYQFDIRFSKAMISIIDSDIRYELREIDSSDDDYIFGETEEEEKFGEPVKMAMESNSILNEEFRYFGELALHAATWCEPSQSVAVSDKKCTFEFEAMTNAEANRIWHVPSLIVFSSNDGKVAGRNYSEMAVVKFTGYSWGAENVKRNRTTFFRKDAFENWDRWLAANKAGMKYTVSCVRKDKEVSVTVDSEYYHIDTHITLADSFDRTVYLATTGELCVIDVIHTIES